MNITKEDNKELLNALAQEMEVPPIDENEVTSVMLAEKTGITDDACRRRLHKKFTSGLLTRRRVRLPNGTIAYGYKEV
jgi:DNA-binding Lrp family transcriptional regulator